MEVGDTMVPLIQIQLLLINLRVARVHLVDTLLPIQVLKHMLMVYHLWFPTIEDLRHHQGHIQ